MPKPHVHLVPPPLSVALDARMAGNEARFIRSGCRPNAVLRPVLCPSKQSGDDNEPGVLKFAVFALRDLKASEEVVLSWEWDDGAVVHQLPAIIEEGLRSGAGPSKMTCVPFPLHFTLHPENSFSNVLNLSDFMFFQSTSYKPITLADAEHRR